MTKEKTFLPIHADLVFKNLFGISKNIKNTTNLLEEFFGFESWRMFIGAETKRRTRKNFKRQ